MTRRGGLLRRAALTIVLAILGVGVVAPLLNGNRFRSQIERALERALNRRVSIGKVRFNLFTGPGFTLDDVLIEDGPGMGIEPFAHVESLEARVRIASLLTGHLAFSKLKLIEPSVNFVKADSGPWNVAPLLNRAAAADTGVQFSAPDIEISDGRLNFKFGDTKSVFYVSNADLEVYPNQSGELIIRFEGEPARTDHTAQGLGHLVARGSLRSGQKEDELHMSVQLEQTAAIELARLFDVPDIGVRAHVASNLKLDGPLSKLNVSGDLRIEDVHRWDLMPHSGEGWTLNYTGFLNVPAQQLDIETRAGDVQGSPVNGKFVASDYLTTPKWEASLNFHDLQAAALLDTARHIGAPIPAGATLNATLDGEIGYSRAGGVQGQLVLNQGSFQLPQGAPTEFGVAPLEIHNSDVRFGPAEIRFDRDQSAQLQIFYGLNTRTVVLELETGALSLAQTKPLIARWLGPGSMPLLEQCRQGNWKGTLIYERKDQEGPGAWTGVLDLQATQMDLPGVAVPLRIAAVSVQLQSGLVQLKGLRGRVGPVALEGDYRYLIAGGRPDRLRLSLGEVQAADLEHLLLPTLSREPGFLARALRLAPSHVPDWLKDRQLEGTVQVKNLLAADASLGSFKARLVWNGASVQLNNIETQRDNMQGAGKLTINLAGPVPRYAFTGQLTNIDYRNGTLDLDGTLETKGLGMDVLLNAVSEGSFSGDTIALAADTQVDDVSGEYRLEATSTGPHLILPKVQLTQGPDVLHGQGASQPDGHIVLELTTGRKQVHLTGMLLPLHPAPEP